VRSLRLARRPQVELLHEFHPFLVAGESPGRRLSHARHRGALVRILAGMSASRDKRKLLKSDA
jgi:hypothetical protein